MADVLARYAIIPAAGLQLRSQSTAFDDFFEQPDGRMPIRASHEAESRARSRAARPAESDGPRDELADDDGEVGQDREGDEERDRIQERGLHEPREQRLADGAEEDREDRDPDLDSEMKRTGSSMSRSAVFAIGKPRSARSSRRERRAVTAYWLRARARVAQAQAGTR